MDEVIYLELDEEIPSVVDKMKELSGRSVALVIPQGAAIIQSVINLKILKKEAEELEKDIVLVTQDRIGRNLASQVGFAVYDSIRSSRPIVNPVRPEPETSEMIEIDLSEKSTRAPKGVSVYNYQESTKNKKKDKPKEKFTPPPIFKSEPVFKKQVISEDPIPTHINEDKKVIYNPPTLPKYVGKKHPIPFVKIIIAIVIVIIGFTLCYLYIPKANVNLVFRSEPFETTTNILVDTNIDTIDANRSAIPGELLEVEKEETKSFPATGTKDLGEKASGSLKLSNGTGNAVSISSGTEFTTNGLVFVSTEGVTVPKATATVDSSGNVVKQNGTANIKVQAKEAGDKYNISSGSFPNSAGVSAELSGSMSGGVSKKIKIVTQDDINKAKENLKNTLVEKTHTELKEKAKDKTLIDSITLDEETDFATTKKANTEADNFEATAKLRSRTIVYKESDYKEMIATGVNKSVPTDKEVILSDQDQITNIAKNVDFSAGTLQLNEQIKTNVGPKINETDIRNNLVHKSKTSADQYLMQISGVLREDITLKPSWWFKKLPLIKKNIIINRSVEKTN